MFLVLIFNTYSLTAYVSKRFYKSKLILQVRQRNARFLALTSSRATLRIFGVSITPDKHSWRVSQHIDKFRYCIHEIYAKTFIV